MPLDFKHLIKDINKIDLEDICSDWQWGLEGQKSVALVSCIGDMFLIGKNGTINWLDTGVGQITKVAENLEEFEILLGNEHNIDNWFLPPLVEQLIEQGKILKENEVYSFKIIPALGGSYSIDNFEVTDISVHFSMTGQIHQQIKDLPDGIRINKVTVVRPI
jgi:hypothetical protein